MKAVKVKLGKEWYEPNSCMNFSDGITNEDVQSISFIMSQSTAAVIGSSIARRISI